MLASIISKPWDVRRLTSINPLITQGNELSGEISVLNKARQVKTCG